MSQVHEWTGYSTLKGNACISMDFMLHSYNGIDPPPPVFDKVAESIVFTDIMSTFGWLETIITTTPTPVINPLPDLVITWMQYELETTWCLLPPPGNVMGVRVWIKNQGQAAATSFMLQVNDAQVPVSGLGAGVTAAVFVPSTSNSVMAIIDPTFMVTESDETNNTRSEVLPVPTPPPPCAVTPTFKRIYPVG